jgi:hypothetical protein
MVARKEKGPAGALQSIAMFTERGEAGGSSFTG